MDVLVHVFYIYFFPLGIIAFLWLGVVFVIVTLVCVPTEDGWERAKEKMQTTKAKKLIKQRGSIVEHPFGTIKQTLGWSHFFVRGKEKVSGENALIMFTYNFRRLLNLIGITLFRKLLIALKNGNIDNIKAEIEAYIACFRVYFFYFLRFLEFMSFREKKCYYSSNFD